MHQYGLLKLIHALIQPLSRFNLISDAQLVQLESELLEESRLSLNYVVLILGSAGISTVGLIADSPAVIIGAMIIAPLMLPIRGLILGTLTGNFVLVQKGFRSITAGALLGIGTAYLFASMLTIPSFGNQILSRTRPNSLDFIVALLAGAIGTFAKCRPRIADSLAGVAIAVALMPPLCVIGIGLAKQEWVTSIGALLLYATNLVGIALACSIVFFIVGYSSQRHNRWLSRGAISTFGLLIFLAGIIAVPLSTNRLIFLRQNYFEALVTNILIEEAEAFDQAKLLESDLNWTTEPLSASLLVLSEETLTQDQVRLLETLITERTGRTVRLEVQIIHADDPRL